MSANASPFRYSPWKPIKHDSSYLLTVYILTYNHEATIERTIKSVLSQRTKYPYIIKILEDCSTDNTLKICKDYTDRYPEKIVLIAQPVNTKAEHSRWAKNSIDTKYWTTIEGDDYWVDEEKIEIMLDALEGDPTLVGAASDTMCVNEVEGISYSLYNKGQSRKKNINNCNSHLISFSRFQYVHTSSIIYRHIFDFKGYTLPLIDTYILYYYLSFGPIYFYNKVMSIHPMTGKGMWSSLTDFQRKFNNEFIHYNINNALEYRFDTVFSVTVRHRKQLKLLKELFGVKYGWRLYIAMRYCSLKLKYLKTYLKK